jgi:methionyl-tRNA synthetase
MDEIKENQQKAQEATSVAEPASAPKGDAAAGTDNFITIDDFARIELRVGEILLAERVPGADKLLRFEIDLGEDKPRQILAGLAEYYDPQTLVGKKVAVVANLKPRKMRGLESQGMILAASLDADDRPAIATFVDEVKNGARLK